MQWVASEMYRWRGNFVNAKEGPFFTWLCCSKFLFSISFKLPTNASSSNSLSLFEISEYRHGYHVIPSSCSLENYRPQYPDFDEKITSELKYIFKADILFLNARNDLHPLFCLGIHSAYILARLLSQRKPCLRQRGTLFYTTLLH